MSSLQKSIQRYYEEQAFQNVGGWKDRGDYQYVMCHLIERSIAMLSKRLSGELLDVGCGTQPYNAYFSHLEKKVNCDFTNERSAVDFVCSACDIPVPDESFDSILCTEVLEHVPDPGRAWAEFSRVLRTGGRILLSAPMYWPAHELPYDFYRYPEHGLRYLAEDNGFEVEELIPRGGVYAFLGQTILMGIQQYFPFRWQRWCWNSLMLYFDRKRCNPKMTLGWTILARKK